MDTEQDRKPVRRLIGYELDKAQQALYDTADGETWLALVEVYERDGVDVTRPGHDYGEGDDVGELYLVDEQGHDTMAADGWTFSELESVGVPACFRD